MESYERFVGMTLDGRYEIEKIIGIGGMAVVFRANDTVTRRFVAIKMLKDDVAKDEAAVKRFINESKAVAMLSHPNIVSIYDVSMNGEFKYIVMEYIEGITLKSYMSKKGPLPLSETINYAEQILSALVHAHEKGIVHRDIKPQNIMLLKNGVIKVTDFGIAKLPDAETVTMTDKAIGTVYYISPEQASGLDIDSRSDIYSLGVMIYEMATGQLPFNADTPVSVALMQVRDNPVPPTQISPNVPRGLEQIILTAMEKSPKRRFQTAEQMYKWLEMLKANSQVIFKPLSAPLEHIERPTDKTKKKKKHQETNYLGISMLPIILGVAFAFLFACIISAYYLISEVMLNDDLDQSYILTVDDFVGEKYYAGMEEELYRKDYSLTVKRVFDESHEPGTIISQSPSAGEKRRVTPGISRCQIEITVSLGTEMFVLPDFTMQDYRIAEEAIKSYGITVKVEQEYNTAVTVNYVYRTEPAAGSTIKTGDTVTIYVSKGIQIGTTQVPDFYGMSEGAARVQIEKNKLTVGAVSYKYSSEPAGTVIGQSRVAFSSVTDGTSVDFVVSLGPDPSQN